MATIESPPPFVELGYWGDPQPVQGYNNNYNRALPLEELIARTVFKNFIQQPTNFGPSEDLPRNYRVYLDNFAPGTILTFDHEVLSSDRDRALGQDHKPPFNTKKTTFEESTFTTVALGKKLQNYYAHRKGSGIILPMEKKNGMSLFSFAYDDSETLSKPEIFKVAFAHSPLIVGQSVTSVNKNSGIAETTERLNTLTVYDPEPDLWQALRRDTARTIRGRFLNLFR